MKSRQSLQGFGPVIPGINDLVAWTKHLHLYRMSLVRLIDRVPFGAHAPPLPRPLLPSGPERWPVSRKPRKQLQDFQPDCQETDDG